MRTASPPRPHAFAIRTMPVSASAGSSDAPFALEDEADSVYHDLVMTSFEKSLFRSRGLKDAETNPLDGLLLVCAPDKVYNILHQRNISYHTSVERYERQSIKKGCIGSISHPPASVACLAPFECLTIYDHACKKGQRARALFV